jgi:hypothetical protein
MNVQELRSELQTIINQKEEDNDKRLLQRQINQCINTIKTSDLKRILKLIEDKQYVNNFSYSNLVDIEENISEMSKNLTTIKEDIDLENFFKDGKSFDFDKLEKEMKRKELKKRFKNFSFQKYKEIIKNPPLEIKNFEGLTVRYNHYFVKKALTLINQMLFNEMDIYILNYGGEGSGKSCWSSQQMLFFYYVLSYCGLVEYAYDVKRMFFSSIGTLLEEQDLQQNNDYFRIMVLDEGFDLNRQNFRDEASMLFKDDMRSSRKLQRIVIINLPQIGELDLSITLSRANFIFECKMENEIKTGMLRKGEINMFILPRGSYIYSPYQRRNLNKAEILNSFSKQLEKKSSYYLESPQNCIVNKFQFYDVWGFNRDIYAEHIKTENKRKRFTGTIKTTEYHAYILWKFLPQLKNWGFNLKNKEHKKMYATINKWVKELENKFVYDERARKKYELMHPVKE